MRYIFTRGGPIIGVLSCYVINPRGHQITEAVLKENKLSRVDSGFEGPEVGGQGLGSFIYVYFFKYIKLYLLVLVKVGYLIAKSNHNISVFSDYFILQHYLF